MSILKQKRVIKNGTFVETLCMDILKKIANDIYNFIYWKAVKNAICLKIHFMCLALFM